MKRFDSYFARTIRLKYIKLNDEAYKKVYGR